jgi:polar amino acid transport system permease protein
MGTLEVAIPQLIYGVSITLLMAVGAWLIGIVPALAVARLTATNDSYLKCVKGLANLFVVLPFLALLFWVHYPLQESLHVVWNPLYTSIGLLSLYVFFAISSMLADELRLARVEHQHVAAVLGITLKNLTDKVLFPLALSRSVPQMLNVSIASVHMTMFGSLIGVEELFRVTLRLNASLLKPIELFTIMAFVYAAVCLPLYLFARLWKKHLDRTI